MVVTTTSSKSKESFTSQGEIKFRDYSTCKSFRGWLTGRISKYAKQENFDMEVVFREILNAYKYFEPDEDDRIVTITLEGWKGEGQTDIYKGLTNDFVIIEKIKDKESNIVEEVRHEVSRVNVNKLLFIIKKWKIGESHSCYEVAEMLGYDWQELWANRVKVYFPTYYYPIKVLEAMKVINYSGKGKITRVL